MAKPFKFRYVNQIAGAFVLIIVLLVVAGVVATAYWQRWFAPTYRVRLLLPEEGSMGLRKGADVMLLGTVVGSVSDVTVNSATGEMAADVTIREDFFNFVRSDSSAAIKKTFGIAGDAYIEISRGRGSPLPREGATLKVSVDRGATELVQEMIDQIRKTAIPTIEEFRRLAADLRDPEGNVQQAISHVRNIAGAVDRREGLVGRVISDPEMARQFEQTIPKLTGALDQVHAILTDTRKTTSQLPDLAASAHEQIKRLPALMEQTQAILGELQVMLKDVQKTTSGLPQVVAGAVKTLDSLPGLVLQTQETIRQMERLIEGFQRHWLVRSYIEQEDPNRRIAPETVGGVP
jgi:phospholipid/cholesterol/gamma-HCH transport system substrate-binding protein